MNKKNTLWTKDFTIITLGSVVSMLGNAMSGFAMSLLVLDYTDSSFLYALYIVLFTLPQVVVPVFSGAILDRFSRKKTIYTLDFISAGLYAVTAAVLGAGWFSFPVLACFCLIVGSINSMYLVAYSSFYPMLIPDGFYSKAYSIASVLETLSFLMIPVATFVYHSVGIVPLLGANALCFFIAASMETQIGAREEYIDRQKLTAGKTSRARQMFIDVKEGFGYLRAEKGLFAVALYFTFNYLASGVDSVVILPFFKDTFNNGDYLYSLVMGMSVAGRAIGGMLHYKFNMPVRYKFLIAYIVYIGLSVFSGAYLFLPVPLMMVCCFMTGILGVTSYTIRVSATQSYVPDEMKGRFNGAFNMLSTVGSLAGELMAGALVMMLPVRAVYLGFQIICLVAAVVFIGGNKEHIAAIYNRQK